MFIKATLRVEDYSMYNKVVILKVGDATSDEELEDLCYDLARDNAEMYDFYMDDSFSYVYEKLDLDDSEVEELYDDVLVI